MSLLAELQSRFRPASSGSLIGSRRALAGDDSPRARSAVRRLPGKLRHGALGKQLDKKPPEVAAEIAARLDVSDLCEPPQVAGPGFINLRLKDDWLVRQLTAALADPRLGVATVARPRTFVIDYSAPNVAKPMHVGHIRSTVIGDALARILRFLGHTVITDNHLGDWGTQFGMIIFGYKHFLDADAYRNRPVVELARLYRLVRQLVDYFEAKAGLPKFTGAAGREGTGTDGGQRRGRHARASGA